MTKLELQQGYLNEDQIRATVANGLAQMPLRGKRVLVLIPDGTRTMPMPLLFRILREELAGRAALDFLVALGTHPPMTDEQLSKLVGAPVENGLCASGSGRASHIYNHAWDDPNEFATLGTIPAAEVREISMGLLDTEIPVQLNRRILDYDHILICGPVFPHEVAGFSGGAKYFFPGIAGPEMIHRTHWLGALLTSYEIIGTAETAVRAVIHRATKEIPRPHSLIALVVDAGGVSGVFCGETEETWRAAAALSSERHIVWLDKPVERVLAVMPKMYDDLWTGAKGMYKLEPAIADGGAVVIYAPHIDEVSYVHGAKIDAIGYHCRDYFTKQWDKFAHHEGGILAHSTHVKGKGTYDAATGVETPRIQVTLATAIPEERCKLINLGYRDPSTIDPAKMAAEGWLVVPKAGEMLYRVR